MTDRQWKTTEIVFFAAILVISLTVFSDHLWNSDEGLVLNAAWQIWNGKLLYVDFTEYISPGTPYLVFFAWQAVGTPSFVAARVLAVLFFVFGLWGFSRAAARLVRRRENALTLSFFLFATFLLSTVFADHKIFSAFTAMWFAYALLRAAERKTTFRIAAAGFWAGLTFVFLQTKGIALLVAGGTFLFLFSEGKFREKVRDGLVFLAGFLVPTLPLLLAWSPRTLFSSLFLYPFQERYLEHTFVSLPFVLFEIALVAAMAAACLHFRDRKLWALLLLQGALFASSAHLVDGFHFIVSVFPSLLFLGAVLPRLFPGRSFPVLQRVPFVLFPVAFMLAFFIVFFLPIRGASHFERSIYATDLLGYRTPGIFDAPEIQAARTVYAGPFVPEVYYELRKPNPFPVSNLLLCDRECQETMLAVFKKTSPEYAFFVYRISDIFAYDKNNPLDAYVRSVYRYCPSASRGDLVTYARSRCPTVPQ